MLALVLAATLWRAPEILRIPNGHTWSGRLPAVAEPAVLSFRARADWRRPAGSHHFLRVRIDGRAVGLMRDRRTPRLTNKPFTLPSHRQALPWFDGDRWRVAYAPLTSNRDTFVLDVSDLLRPDTSSSLTLDHGPATSAGAATLVVEDLRLEPAQHRPSAMLPPPPDWRTPRLRLPKPPRFQAAAQPGRVRMVWGNDSVDVETRVRGGLHVWRRALVTLPTHVEVHDTVTNPTASPIGLRVRHAIRTDAAWMHIGGRPEPDVVEIYTPWNPTVFTPLARGGVGLVAEDDVLRQQVHAGFDPRDGTLGLATTMFCLAPGDSHTFVWSVYPSRTQSYWDFINTVRADWGVNRTVPGSYIWFTPDQVLALSPVELRDRLARQQVSVASMWGGWIDPAQPSQIGFGTAVMRPEFAAYRRRIHAAIRKLERARSGITVLLYFDAQRDSSPDAPRRYRASLLDGERIDWGGRFIPAWGMAPVAGDRFSETMLRVARKMRRLGARGLYWDEMDGVDYVGPRLTTRRFDGRSCRLGADAEVETRAGLANLLGEPAKLAWARDTFVLGNGPPTTRRFQNRTDVRMVEAQHDAHRGAAAHLTTPLGYIGARRDWATVLEKINEPLLVAGTRLDYAYDLPARMFPFTPEYLQPGTLRGRERIITTVSGTHGWIAATDPVRAFRYDTTGREHEAHWPTKRRAGGVFVRVHLDPGEAAVIERSQP